MVEAYPQEDEAAAGGWGENDDDEGEGWGNSDEEDGAGPANIFTVPDADMFNARDKGYKSVRSRAIAT